jgi:hypothetical protein
MSINHHSSTVVEMEEEILLPALLPYVDKLATLDKPLYVRHPLCHQSIGDSPSEKSIFNTAVNLHYKFNLKEYTKCFNKKDFEAAIFIVHTPVKAICLVAFPEIKQGEKVSVDAVKLTV